MKLAQININCVHCFCRRKQNGGYSAVHYHVFQMCLFICLLSKLAKLDLCFSMNQRRAL